MNTWNLIQERFRARSLKSSFYRFLHLHLRYGMTPYPFQPVLENFVRFMTDYQSVPTFPVTAMTVHRHPDLFKRLQDSGTEFAIHGYRHVDYTQLEPGSMREHIEKAIRIFRETNIHYSGFRFPFLRRNPERSRVLSEFDFSWESSEVISWPIPETVSVDPEREGDYQQILKTYQVVQSENTRALPYPYQGMTEIPVSVPDDDILSERLRFGSGSIRTVWLTMLNRTHRKKEMFVMQIHPERFHLCRPAIASVLDRAVQLQDVWIAPLGEIYQWWTGRMKTKYHISEKTGGEWVVQLNGPANLGLEVLGGGRVTRGKISAGASLCVKTGKKPVVGIQPPITKEFIDFLTQEGYLFEEAGRHQEYAVKMNGNQFNKTFPEQFSRMIESTREPVLKLRRWPYPYESVLSVTGDIDGVDIWDYWTRFYGT